MLKRLSRLISISLLMSAGTPAIAAQHVTVSKENGAWYLKINGAPFFVKGMSYNPIKIGEDPNAVPPGMRDWAVVDDNMNGRIDSAYDAYVDLNNNSVQDSYEPVVGDFQLMKEMGVNTIRLYHHASNSPTVQAGYGGNPQQLLQFNHAPNKDVLRDLYNTYGIRVMMGDFLGAYTVGSGAVFAAGTDYTNATQRERMRASVIQMVNDFKDEDFLLMYVLGNENNYSFTATNAGIEQVAYAQFLEEMAQLIHSLDPNHPVAICIGDIAFDLNILDEHAPSVDIYGSNAYRNGTFDDIWTQVKTKYDKPILYTEYGDIFGDFPMGQFGQLRQKTIHEAAWLEIEANAPAAPAGTKNAIGGVVMEWVDNWWQSGAPNNHFQVSPTLEWQGILAQIDAAQSPYGRQHRMVYDTYKRLWRENMLTGDYNMDCVVDINDHTDWKSKFNHTVIPGNSADGNGDGIVDAADSVVWRDNLGAFCAPAAADIPFPADESAYSTWIRVKKPKFNPAHGEKGEIEINSAGTNPTEIRVIISDRRGYEVADFITTVSGDKQLLTWDGRDNNGSTVASGVYFGQAIGDGKTQKFKLIVIK